MVGAMSNQCVQISVCVKEIPLRKRSECTFDPQAVSPECQPKFSDKKIMKERAKHALFCREL